MKKILVLLVVVAIAITSIGCENDAYIASQNLSEAADQFEIYRRVVFYNGITDEYILMIEGYCSVEFYSDKFVVIVKTEEGQFMKHYLGRADNVFPFVEQLDPATVSSDRYRVTFKPTTVIPNIQMEVGN